MFGFTAFLPREVSLINGYQVSVTHISDCLACPAVRMVKEPVRHNVESQLAPVPRTPGGLLLPFLYPVGSR